MKKAYIYARVSTEEQAEEGKSIETQERICRKWANDNNYAIVGIFKDEGKSATTLNRPALQELLSKCQEKNVVNAILVQDTDRLARNTIDHLNVKALLKKKEIEVISISQPMLDDSPEGNLMDTMIASFNAFQSQITGRKTSKVLEEKAKMGWFPGGIPPLGYKNILNPNPASTLDKQIIGLDEETAPYIKQVFEMYSTGNYNVKNIADFLNDKGIKSPRGYQIHTSLVCNILKNEFYIGKLLWNEKKYIGKHQRLIEDDMFAHVQRVMQVHNQNASRKRKHDFLLRGFVFCSDCGRRLWADVHKKKSGTIFNLYFCPNCKRDTYVNREELEKQVAGIFTTIQISDEYVSMTMEKARIILEENRTSQDSERRRLTAQKSKVEKAMREAEDGRFVHHTLTDETFQRIYSRYETQLGGLDDELAKLGKDHSRTIETLKKVLLLAENIGRAYEIGDYTTKRSYLGLFFRNFKARNGKIEQYALSDELKPLVENGSVRVSVNGLPAPYDSIQQGFEAILRVFENVSYIGELRQRWLEIKKLLKGGLPDAIPAAMQAK